MCGKVNYLLLTGALQRGSVQFAAYDYGLKIVCLHLSLMAATFTPVLNLKNSWQTSAFSREEVALNTPAALGCRPAAWA